MSGGVFVYDRKWGWEFRINCDYFPSRQNSKINIIKIHFELSSTRNNTADIERTCMHLIVTKMISEGYSVKAEEETELPFLWKA
jgi:hypothetical protein